MEKTLSIIIPVYNEEENVKRLYLELKEVINKIDYKSEIVYVDDCSSDGTLEALKSIAQDDKKVKFIRFSKNYGQTAAISTGIKNSTGDVIVLLDGDLQNDPADIPMLLKNIEDGNDVVSGWRKNRKDTFITRKLPSYIANYIISLFTGLKIHDFGCTLKAYKREVLENFAIYGEMHRLLSAYCFWQGAKVTEVVVNHRPRLYGKSKYGINRTLKVILDLMVIKFILSYLTRPIYIFGGIAITAFLAGTAVNLFVIGRKIFFSGQWLSPMFFIGFLLWSMSVICLLLGIIMEVVVRLYLETKDELPFKIAKKENF
ncbi:MAG: glycosyl transferase [Elusimicrobia bacterium RIFOXYA2_FULL_39_19]|nr:MAG: glycosyl transferase [Elusimicrobia bacterium RIFOXYA2_FULL_39_19]